MRLIAGHKRCKLPQKKDKTIAKAQYQQKQRTKKRPARVAREISSLKAPGALARYRDKETGARLNPAAIAAETNRRIAEKLTPGRPKEHPLIRKTRERNATRTLGAPLKPAKPPAAGSARRPFLKFAPEPSDGVTINCRIRDELTKDRHPSRKHVEWQSSEQSPMAGRLERRIRNL
jgi:hypothetical protein